MTTVNWTVRTRRLNEFHKWQLKVKNYFQWRESLTPNENGDLDHYVDDDRQRREQYGITEADEVRWEASKYPDPNLPF